MTRFGYGQKAYFAIARVELNIVHKAKKKRKSKETPAKSTIVDRINRKQPDFRLNRIATVRSSRFIYRNSPDAHIARNIQSKFCQSLPLRHD